MTAKKAQKPAVKVVESKPDHLKVDLQVDVKSVPKEEPKPKPKPVAGKCSKCGQISPDTESKCLYCGETL